MNGILLSDYLNEVCSRLESLDKVFSCKIYGGDYSDALVKELNLKVKGDQVQCLISFETFSTEKRIVSLNNSVKYVEIFMNILVFGNIDRSVDKKGFSTVACDRSQEILGFLNENKFGFDNEIDTDPNIIAFNQAGEIANHNFQVWQVSYSQKIKLKLK
jgi:hypothetical protein